LTSPEQIRAVTHNRLPLARMNNDQAPLRRIGDGWSGISGLLHLYSTQTIKEILGKAALPVFRIKYSGTYKGPVLDEADSLVKGLDENSRDRFVRGCTEEIVSCESNKNENLALFSRDPDMRILRELERVLSRLGFGIRGKTVFPLTLKLDIETVSLPVEVNEAIAEALG